MNHQIIKLQNAFDGTGEKLAANDINILFKNGVNSELNIILYKALEQKIIDVDICLVQILQYCKKAEYIIPLAFCLRWHADVNMYVSVPKFGILHILGYIYLLLGDSGLINQNENNDILNTIILMFIVQGSKPSMSIFDIKTEQSTQSLSVIDWLNSKGYKTILNQVNLGDVAQLSQFVDGDSLVVLSLILDKVGLNTKKYEDKDIYLAIKFFTIKNLEKIPLPQIITYIDDKTLSDSVIFFNFNSYEYSIKKGNYPSYVLINKILTEIVRNRHLSLVVRELEKMLYLSINIGFELDNYQLDIIKTIGTDFADKIITIYQQPSWKKICNNASNVRINDLKQLALSLNINPTSSKTLLCYNLNNLSLSDKEALKNGARKRQELRLSSHVSSINEHIGDEIPTFVCRNKSLLQENIFDYNDLNVAYYRDDQGVIWCFTLNQFKQLLNTGLNPYNSALLPDTFKFQLQHQLNVLANFTDVSSSPRTFSDSLEFLTLNDSITNHESDKQLTRLFQLARDNSFNDYSLAHLSTHKLSSALNSIGYNIDFSPLTAQHALVTTGYILNFINNINSSLVSNFFNFLSIDSL